MGSTSGLNCVCRSEQIDANSGHRPPSEGVCKTLAKNAQHFDSSTSRACWFNVSSRVAALVPNLNYREFCTQKSRARTGNEKSSKKSLRKSFLTTEKYVHVALIPARTRKQGFLHTINTRLSDSRHAHCNHVLHTTSDGSDSRVNLV